MTPEVSLKQQSCHICFLKNTSWLWWMGGKPELVFFLLSTSSLLHPSVPELLIRLHLNSHSPQHSVFRQGSPVLCCLKTMSASWGSPEFDWLAKGAGKGLAGSSTTFPRHPHLCYPQPSAWIFRHNQVTTAKLIHVTWAMRCSLVCLHGCSGSAADKKQSNI